MTNLSKIIATTVALLASPVKIATTVILLASPVKGETEVLDFHADWCAPCVQMEPIVQRLKSDGYNIRKVNTDKDPEMLKMYNVSSIPTFIRLDNGVETKRIVGATTESALRSLFTQVVYSTGDRHDTPINGLVTHDKSIVRIQSTFTQGASASTYHSSGVIIGNAPGTSDRIVILTVSHGIKDGAATTVFVDGVWKTPVTIHRYAPTKARPDIDIAAVVVKSRTTAKRGLSKRLPAPCEPLWTAGFPGSSSQYKTKTGRVDHTTAAGGLWINGISFQSGESGGPVLDANGKIVAIIGATTDVRNRPRGPNGRPIQGWATTVYHCRHFLTILFGSVPGEHTSKVVEEPTPAEPPEEKGPPSRWQDIEKKIADNENQTKRNKVRIDIIQKSSTGVLEDVNLKFDSIEDRIRLLENASDDSELVQELVEKQSTIMSELKKLQGVVGDIQKNQPKDGSQGPKGDPGKDGKDGLDGKDGKDADISRVVALEDKVKDLEEMVDKILNMEKPADKSRIIYFTSTLGCKDCRPLDERIRKLKNQGYPITIIDLEPTNVSVKGVPRIHIPDQKRTIEGISNCSTFLTLLVPR